MLLLMKNLIILFVTLFCLCSEMAGQQKCKLNVGSFNLRYDNEGDKENSWEHRKDMVVSLVQFHDFDVWGIQEGLIHQVKELVKDSMYTYVGVGRDDGKEGGEHAAVLFKKDRFNLLDSGNYWLSETQDNPSLGWDAQCRRVCSWAKLKDKVSDKEFYFFSVHFDHIGKVARRESALIMLANIKKIAGNIPAICVGDFNGTPDSEPIKILKTDGLLLDSRVVSKTSPYGTVGTTNQFNLNAPMKNRIDYIFITRNIQVNKYGTLNEFQYGRFPSDHFPIMIEAEF